MVIEHKIKAFFGQQMKLLCLCAQSKIPDRSAVDLHRVKKKQFSEHV